MKYLFIGVYAIGCYQMTNSTFQKSFSPSLTGPNVIQQCLNLTKGYQGFGLRKLQTQPSETFGCYTGDNAEKTYNEHGPAPICGTEQLGNVSSNATAVFLFSGDLTIFQRAD